MKPLCCRRVTCPSPSPSSLSWLLWPGQHPWLLSLPANTSPVSTSGHFIDSYTGGHHYRCAFRRIDIHGGPVASLSLRAAFVIHLCRPASRLRCCAIGAVYRVGGPCSGCVAPRVTLSTIHQQKGGEADNVIVSLDIGKMAYEEYRTNPISEHRLFYVAFSRAKENLYIITPQSREAYRI